MSSADLTPGGTAARSPSAPRPAGLQVLDSREVPLGGPRATTVRRTLPHRDRSFVGAWCFADHYGPDDVRHHGGMDVPPHPHTGLQTVSWLFSGEIEHRDSLGVHALVRPGEMNLMTSGRGICHSEVSTGRTTVLHGVQLWVVLPERDKDTARDFQHVVPEPVDLARATGVHLGGGHGSGRVFLGQLAGSTSPVRASTPLLGAEITLAPDTRAEFSVDPRFEHGILVDAGPVMVDGVELRPTQLGVRDAGSATLRIASTPGRPARLILLGGTPFDEQIVMWWNFVGRSHDDIVTARREWQEHSERFGSVSGYRGRLRRLPAPELPQVRLLARTRQGRGGPG